MTDFGYKTNKNAVSAGTNFEYLDDLFLSPRLELNNEKIETSSSASSLLRKQEGSYFDITGHIFCRMIKEIKDLSHQMVL